MASSHSVERPHFKHGEGKAREACFKIPEFIVHKESGSCKPAAQTENMVQYKAVPLRVTPNTCQQHSLCTAVVVRTNDTFQRR